MSLQLDWQKCPTFVSSTIVSLLKAIEYMLSLVSAMKKTSW